MHTLAYAILFLPLLAALIIPLGTRGRRELSGLVGIGSLVVGFVLSLILFFHALGSPDSYPMEHSLPWLSFDWLQIEFGVLLDPLSLLMLLVVTGVGSAIFIYSWGYMQEDQGFSRYFACLSLFAFSMLGIVLSNNFLQMFIFWELVGVSSYLLIGFWYQKDSAAEAGKKAFLVNRVGDFGFIVGILLLWSLSDLLGGARTFNFGVLQAFLPAAVGQDLIAPPVLTLLGLLIFCGVLGKSAQFPLHVWLPDAMEGPTPVSALIHAATMVAAGVYLLARAFFLFSFSPTALLWVAHVGCFTAIFAAVIALVQNDIKRVLAYSTLSQLGYMVLALGLGDSGTGMFHLTTHAFFKALLFLGAGSVIHAAHTQDIWEMGGLLKKMPQTGWTFVVGTLALCGIFPLSGFWSKDAILSLAHHHGPLLYWTATAAAFLTALYMGRVLFVAFLGKPREKASHAQESPKVMTWPLIFLATLSAIGGFIGIPAFLSRGQAHAFDLPVALTSTAVALAGLFLAYAVYARQWIPADTVARRFSWVRHVLIRKFYMDEIYDWIVLYVQQSIAVLCLLFDRFIVMGLGVGGTAWITRKGGDLFRRLQTGRIQTYVMLVFMGMVFLMYRWMATP